VTKLTKKKGAELVKRTAETLGFDIPKSPETAQALLKALKGAPSEQIIELQKAVMADIETPEKGTLPFTKPVILIGALMF